MHFDPGPEPLSLLQTNAIKQTLAFLHDCALNKNRPLTKAEQAVLQTVHNLLEQADEIIICLGGKAGRLGECVVGTGLLEGVLEALRYLKKASIPVDVFMDHKVSDLFDARCYPLNPHFDLHFIPSQQAADLQKCVFQSLTQSNKTQITSGGNVLVLDFHGANDGMPYLQFIEDPSEPAGPTEQDEHYHIAILGQCFRVGIRSYAKRGPERRYADFIETLFALPAGTIDGKQAQPRLHIVDEEHIRYYQLAKAFGLNLDALSVVCFFQSVAPAKCYERWDEVLQLLCEQLALHMPGQKVDFVLVCGPDEDLPQGIRKADIEEWLGDFSGVEANARVLICSTPSLRDLAILITHAALVLSNDTGPGHIAGALAIPTVTPFLPGNIYSKKVWSSTLSHHGVTLDPNPYSFAELEAAVIWGKTNIINSIEPQYVCATAYRQLRV